MQQALQANSLSLLEETQGKMRKGRKERYQPPGALFPKSWVMADHIKTRGLVGEGLQVKLEFTGLLLSEGAGGWA